MRRAFALLSLIALFASAPAHADERTEARAHFKRGMEAIRDGKYEEGIVELKRAYEIRPHPNVLYNIARAHVDIGDLENGIAYFKTYLETDPKDRDEVRNIVASLEVRLERQKARQRKKDGEVPKPAPTAQDAPPTTPAPAPTAPQPQPAPPRASEVKTEDIFAETVVTASKSAQSPLDAPSSTSIITEQDIRLSGITKIPELLRRLAGVDVMQTTGAQTEVSLRGFNQRLSNKVLVLLDGRSVFVDLLGATFWTTLAIGVEDIERIEVVRGPGSALYGADAFNGVINILTKPPGQGKNSVTVGFGDRLSTHATLRATGGHRAFGYRASAGYDYLPRWSREVPEGRRDLRMYAADQDRSQRTARIDLRTVQQLSREYALHVGGGVVGGSTEILGVGPINDHIIDFQVSDVTAQVTGKHLFARVFWNDFRGNSGNNAAQIGQMLLSDRFRVDVVDAEARFVADFETGSGIRHALQVGASYRYKDVMWSFQDRHRFEHHYAAFAHDEVKLGDHVALVGDLRADYVPYLGKIIPSPKGSLLVHPSKQSTLRAIVATAFRKPTFLESYLGLPIQLPIAGGSTLTEGVRSDAPDFKVKEEKIFSLEAGYLQDFDKLTIDSAFFYNRASDFIQLASARPLTVSDLSGQNPRQSGSLDPVTGLYPLFLGGWENTCRSFAMYGAEVGARAFPIEGLDVYGNYTFSYVDGDESGCSAEQKAKLLEDQRTSMHKLNAGVQVRTKSGVDGELAFHYVSPQVWSEQIISTERQRIEYQSYRLDPYTLLNTRIGYRIPKPDAEVSLVGFNVLGTKHRQHPFGQLVDRRVMAFVTYRF